MPIFKRSELEPGMVFHERGTALISKLIIGSVGSWGSHDGLFAYMGGKWYIAESRSPFARLTPLEDYEREMNQGICECRVYAVKNATPQQGELAVEWWIKNVQGSPYDWFAFPRLLIKAKLVDFSKSKWKWLKKIGDKHAGFEWAHWCTEGVAAAWSKGAGLDVWGKPNPTPYTTEKRLGHTLEDISSLVIQ